jgi:hypothetical protein
MRPARCTGKTKAGKACKAHPLKGTDRCGRHPGEVDAPDVQRVRTERWDRVGWLHCFEYTGMVTAACALMGISRQTAYEERQRNEGFAVAWHDVEERVVERMEREAVRRAVEGVETPLVSAGKLVTTVRTYSDGLLQFMLKARRPETYRERVDLTHGGGVKIDKTVRVDLAKLDADELAALERISDKLAETPEAA